MRNKITLNLNKGLIQLARTYGAGQEKALTVSDVVEMALDSFLPKSMGFQMKDNKTTFLSGPTISQMKINKPTLKDKG